jgi:DNA polymerase V
VSLRALCGGFNVIALIDINNCYVSCERIFQPELNNKPVIVLSNNDGCAIARSNEAKALGIKMGQPLFQLTDIIKRHDVRVRSANFTLYGDMSHRIMTIIAELTPKIEIYSIDECFVDVTGMPDVEAWSKTLRKTIYQWTGLPVSIGIARTKVLSKLANKVAKSCSGVYLISAHDERDILAVTKIDDLWGIGKKLSIRLKLMGIYTAMQLVNSPDQLVKDKFSVVLSRLQKELRGESVFALDDHIEAKKQIVCSRSFGHLITDKDQLHQALLRFVSLATEKLRRQKSEARCLQVVINTNPYSKNAKQYHRSACVILPTHTANTTIIARYATQLLNQLFRPNYEYQRAGIMLMDIAPAQCHQYDLIEAPSNDPLDEVKDMINRRFGRNKIMPARLVAKKQPWEMRQDMLSKKFTTRWIDLLTAK